MIPIVRPAGPARAAPRPAARACSVEDPLEPRRVGDVVVEGGLDRARLERSPRADRRVVAEVRAVVRRAAVALAEALDQARRPGGAAARRSSRPRSRVRRSAVFGPIPGISRGGAPAKRSRRLLAGQHDEAARLLGVRGDLGDELVRPDPDRGVEPQALADRRTSPLIRAIGSGRPGEVEVDLVERDRLGRHPELADERHHLAPSARGSGPCRPAGGPVRAQAPRVRDRHRRADPERPRLIRGGGDHRPRPAARRRSPACRAAPGRRSSSTAT